MDYGFFKSLPLTPEEIRKKKLNDILNFNKFHKLKNYIVAKNKLHELKSDYLGIDSYYYCPKNNIVYKITNTNDPKKLKFVVDNDQHIRQINGLKLIF